MRTLGQWSLRLGKQIYHHVTYTYNASVFIRLSPPNDSNCQHKEHVVFLSSSAVDCRERSERLMPFPLIGTEYRHDG